MYVEHPAFVQPYNEEVKVWRYMDFTKFVSLIHSKSLYFTRADKFEDPFEGSWTRSNVLARETIPGGVPEEDREKVLEVMRSMGEINKNWPRYKAINCWHMNDYESAAMWKLYLKSNEGIAIQSTYRKLKNSFADEEKVYLGVVKYIDYELEYIDDSNIMESFMHKRKSFEHEKEVRALVSKPPVGERNIDFKKETIAQGLPVKVDIEKLIENVFVSPSAPEWFAELVSQVTKNYGYNFKVVHSSLDENPLF